MLEEGSLQNQKKAGMERRIHKILSCMILSTNESLWEFGGYIYIFFFPPSQTLFRINEGTCNDAGKLLGSGDGVEAACLNDC